jgi:transcriptional regulator with XRE-family HTH domain
MRTKKQRITKVEKLRKAQFLSVRDLAEKANLNPNTITNYETGKTEQPSRRVMESIAKALGVDITALYEENIEAIALAG